jgi:hypothetical protein
LTLRGAQTAGDNPEQDQKREGSLIESFNVLAGVHTLSFFFLGKTSEFGANSKSEGDYRASAALVQSPESVTRLELGIDALKTAASVL